MHWYLKLIAAWVVVTAISLVGILLFNIWHPGHGGIETRLMQTWGSVGLLPIIVLLIIGAALDI